jgi:serine/threonine protein kinase
MPEHEKHPGPDRLRAFDQGRLGSTDWSAVEEHLQGCAVCSNWLETLPEQRLPDLLAEYDAGRALESAAAELVTQVSARAVVLPAAEVPAELAEHPRYRVLELIGAGGMGTVYKAEHRLMRRPVALKVVHRHLLNRPDAAERFRREVHAAAQLAHPNIVLAHDAEQAGAAHFLIMEFVEGETLDRLVERCGPLPVSQACGYVRQAALGLQHAHEQGMLHRDLKPANLMATPGGHVKILDFGLALFAQQCQASPGLTPDGALVGTPSYLAPEQAREPGAADVRADLYSLGCTLYHLLAGRPPFGGNTVLQQLMAHQEKAPKPLSAFRSDIPETLNQLVERLLAKAPAGRFRSAAELAQALAPFSGDAPAPPPERARRRRILAGVLGLGLCALIVGSWIAWQFAADGDASSAPEVAAPGTHVAGALPPDRDKPSDKDKQTGNAPPVLEDKIAVPWSAHSSARDQVVVWLTENNNLGPDHPVIADMAKQIDREVKDGQAFLIRLGGGLMRSQKATLLAGRHRDLYAFTFAPEQVRDWVRPRAGDFVASTAPRQEVHDRPLVSLSSLRVDDAVALDAVGDIKGTIDYRRLGEVKGTLMLRLLCITKRGTTTLLGPMPKLSLATGGSIRFNFGPMFKADELAEVPHGPVVFFVELGRRPLAGGDIPMELLSNMVATPVFFSSE